MNEIYNIKVTVHQPLSAAKCCVVHGPTYVSCSFIYRLPALKIATEPFFLFVETSVLPDGKFTQESKRDC